MTTSSPPESEEKTKNAEFQNLTFWYWLGRMAKSYWRWWYAVPAVLLIGIICASYGVSSGVVLVLLGFFSGIGCLYVLWVSEHPPKARRLIFGLIVLPIWFTVMDRMRREQLGWTHSSVLERVRDPAPALSYWNTTVAALFTFRYQIATGNEPAGEYMRRRIQEYQTAYQKAKGASTIGVDPDLFTLVNRHLATDERQLQLIQRLNDYYAQRNAPTDTVPVEQRSAQWGNLVARIEADPSIVDKLPEGPERAILQDTLAIMTEVSDQHREIEIMQAVLQERYPGTLFPLPKPSPR